MQGFGTKNGNEMGILQRMNVFLFSVDEGMKWSDDGNGLDRRWRWNEEMSRMALQKGVE